MAQRQTGDRRRTHAEREDTALLQFRTDRGVIAQINTNWLTPFKARNVTVATRQKYIMGDLLTRQVTECFGFKPDGSVEWLMDFGLDERQRTNEPFQPVIKLAVRINPAQHAKADATARLDELMGQMVGHMTGGAVFNLIETDDRENAPRMFTVS